MSSKHIRADVNIAFPTAEIAVMGPDGAVNIVYRTALQNAADPEALRAKYTAEYREMFANPFKAAELGFVDEVIQPRAIRQRLNQWLDILKDKRESLPAKKHGNMPL